MSKVKQIIPALGVMAIFKDNPRKEDVTVPVVCWALRSRDGGADEVVGMIWAHQDSALHLVDDSDLFVDFVGYARERGRE